MSDGGVDELDWWVRVRLPGVMEVNVSFFLGVFG